MGFAHFSLEPTGQREIAYFHGHIAIDTIFKLLEAEDTITQQYAALCTGNLASNDKCRDRLIRAGAMETLFRLCLSTSMNTTTRSSCIFALANLTASVKFHSHVLDHVDDILGLVDSYDQDMQKFSCLLVQNLCSNKLTWPILVAHGTLQSLLNVLSSPTATPEAKLHCTAALQVRTIPSPIFSCHFCLFVFLLSCWSLSF